LDGIEMEGMTEAKVMKEEKAMTEMAVMKAIAKAEKRSRETIKKH
jgi:hypothetical protein